MKKFLLSLLTLLIFSQANAQTFGIKASQNPICPGGRSVLEATSGFYNYKWSTGDSSRSIVVTKEGWYHVSATDSRSSNVYRDSIKITFYKTQTLQVGSSASSICKGDSVRLFASSGFRTYHWVDSNANKSVGSTREIWVKPTQNTTYTIYAYDSNQCVVTGRIKIEVKTCNSNTQCPSDLIQVWPKAYLCGNNDTLSLEAKNTYDTYSWSSPGTTLSGNKKILYVTHPGKYILTVTSGKDTCRDTIEIVRYNIKQLAISVSPVKNGFCPGDTVKLSATSGFKNYAWSNNKNTREIEIIFQQQTQFWVYGSDGDSTGCPAKAWVTLHASDSCKKDSTNHGCKDLIKETRIEKCGVNAVELSSLSGYKKYFWSNGKQTQNTKVEHSGRYYVLAMDDDCNVCVDSIDVFLHKKMEFNVEHNASRKLCKGDTLIMEATKGMKNYWWSTGHRGTRLVKMVPDSSMTVVVEAVDSNGCEYRKVLEIIVDTCKTSRTAFPDFNDEVIVFPNPADAYLHIVNPNARYQGYTAAVYDLQGKVLYRVEMGSEELLTMDLSTIASGSYMLVMSDGVHQIAKRVVIQ